MAYSNSNLPFEKMLLKFVTEENPMLKILKGLCDQLMEAKFSSKLGTDKSERSPERNGYGAGYRTRHDTRIGTMYLVVPNLEKVVTYRSLY